MPWADDYSLECTAQRLIDKRLHEEVLEIIVDQERQLHLKVFSQTRVSKSHDNII